MRCDRLSAFVLLLPLAFVFGCDRGAHPKQAGKPAPDFTFRTERLQFTSPITAAKVVLLNFWWSQCAPCIEEMPSLEQFHHENPNVVILAVSIDDDPASYPVSSGIAMST